MLTKDAQEDRAGSWWPRALGYFAVAAAGLLSFVLWQQGHPPLLAPAAAVLAVALPLSRRLPAPAAGAAALILVVGFYLAAAVALGLTQLSAPLSPAVSLGVLVAPCLGIFADIAMRRPPASRDEPSASKWAATTILMGAFAGPTLLLLVVGIAITRFGEAGLAFAMSGDARNHVLIARQIMSAGGMDGDVLAMIPALSDAVLALMMAVPGRAAATQDQVLSTDIWALAALVVTAAIAWSLSTVGVIWAVGRLRRAPQALSVAAASLIPLAGLGLGIALRDGFFSAVFALPLLISALCLSIWTVRAREHRRGWMLAWVAIAVSLPTAATAWSLMLPIQAMVILGALIGVHRRVMLRDTLKVVGIALVGMAAALLLLLPVVGRVQALADFGSIAPPVPALFATVPLVVVAIAAAGLRQIRRSVFLPYLLGTLGAGAVVLFLVLRQPPGQEWNYYPSKVAWMWSLVGLPLLLTPAAFVEPRRLGTARGSQVLSVVLAAAGSLAVLGLAEASSRVTSPVLPRAVAGLGSGAAADRGTFLILPGWGQPDARLVDLVLRLGESDRLVVIWAYSDPANDRLGNFWMSMYERPEHAASTEIDFRRWAYGDPFDINQLCTLLNQDADRDVATRDPALPATVASQCGLPADRVWVLP